MTHEGRMERGEAYFKSGNKWLLKNADTLYYLDNKPKEVVEVKPKKKAKEEKEE